MDIMYNHGYGLEDNPRLLLRRLRTRLDSVRGTPEALRVEEVPVNPVG
ncbi:MAG TPA: hypothetical protein VG844_10820 [Terracidiphilus sp.]|nr:hypothetical protein [Terracidiphilus sp.]